MKNIELLEYGFDISKLENEAVSLFNDTGFDFQISLKHRKDIDENSRLSDGSGAAFGAGKILLNEDFTEFNESLDDSYLKTVHDTVAKDYAFGRMRLMRLVGRQCMSLHFDLQKRIHIPIMTNENCLMLVDSEIVHLPATGDAYLVDTTKRHTALNSNKTFDRIHLLFDLL